MKNFNLSKLAKEIRKPGEKWPAAMKRAAVEAKKPKYKLLKKRYQ